MMRVLVRGEGSADVRITATAPLRPTEDAARVRAAVTSFLPGADVQEAADAVQAAGSDPSPLRQRIWELRIIDAMRGRLLAGCDGPRARVALNKQAAYLGRVSPAVGTHAMGDLHVEFEVEPGDPWPDAEAFAWWLCPETKDGQVVGPAEP